MTDRAGSLDEVVFEVQPAGPDAGGGFQGRMLVNGVEMTSKGWARHGPIRHSGPINLLMPRDEPHELPVARCGCGVYWCGVTDLS